MHDSPALLVSIETHPPADDYGDQQRALGRFNKARLVPGLGDPTPYCTKRHDEEMRRIEEKFLAKARAEVVNLIEDLPTEARAFISWFEHLKHVGPGQGDLLFPWLAEEATLEQMRWFLEQEVAGEAGFDDLVAMTQVKMPTRAKLEMARNYWDEMGRGDSKGMHGLMLDKLAGHLGLKAEIETTVPESLALGNMMMALASNRNFAFHSVGALGAIEMTAPVRAAFVTQGLNRLGVSRKQSHYFALHAVLDVKHSDAWNVEVLETLVQEDPRRARAIAEGAVLRLWCGQKCFERYRSHFGLPADKKTN